MDQEISEKISLKSSSNKIKVNKLIYTLIKLN